MGTELINDEDEEYNIYFKRIYGGKDKGTCYVIADKLFDDDMVSMTEKEWCFMVYRKLANEWDEIQSKDTLYDGHIRYLRTIKPLLDYYKEKFGFDDY